MTGFFKGVPSWAVDLLPLVSLKIVKWVPNERIQRHSYEQYLVQLGVMLEKRVILWCPPLRVFNSNDDRAAREKSGPTVIREVLQNNRGDVLSMFSKSLGVKASNEAEVLAILEVLQMLPANFHGRLALESNSMNTIYKVLSSTM